MGAHGEADAALTVGLSGELTATGHRLMARVYYADTDFSGVVYHARYLEFLERGRSDFLRLAGVHHTELADGKHGEKIVWVVRRMEIDFRAPARIDDILTIDTRTEDISGARIFMAQQLKRGDDGAGRGPGRGGDHRRERPAAALSQGMDRSLHAARLPAAD